MKDLSQLAESVIKELDAQLVKQAKMTYTSAEPLKTETGQLMRKLAEQIRVEGSAGITYTDLARFRKAYNV